MHPRASGILLHPTSFPSRGGVGDFGPAAYEFLDFLTEAKQTLWQILPLGPVGYGNSPYSSTSAFAGNPLMISLERLAERGWIDSARLKQLLPATGNVDFEKVWDTKYSLIEEAARGFLKTPRARSAAASTASAARTHGGSRTTRSSKYCAKSTAGSHGTSGPKEIARRDNDAQHFARERHAADLDVTRAVQFAFFEQWKALHAECARRGIQIMGDVAIFVSFDSADVWTHPDIFRLDATSET